MQHYYHYIILQYILDIIIVIIIILTLLYILKCYYYTDLQIIQKFSHIQICIYIHTSIDILYTYLQIIQSDGYLSALLRHCSWWCYRAGDRGRSRFLRRIGWWIFHDTWTIDAVNIWVLATKNNVGIYIYILVGGLEHE